MEVERKYHVVERDPERAFRRIRGLTGLGGYRVVDSSRYFQVDRYFDTVDDDFLKTDRIVRLRQKNGIWKMDYKAPKSNDGKGLHERYETSRVILRSNGGGMFGGYVPLGQDETLLKWADGKLILDTLIAKDYRTKMILREEKGDNEVELVLDPMLFSEPGNPEIVKPAWIVELEAVKGEWANADALAVLGEALEERIKLRPMTESKYRYGRSLLGG